MHLRACGWFGLSRAALASPATTLALALAALAVGMAPISAVAAQQTPAEAANVVPLVVHTPHSGFNRMVVTVMICAPGTDRCATIDDIMVDTGSTGLRVEASAIPRGFVLPAFFGQGRKSLAECLRFVHDVAWGPLYRADLHIGGLTAEDLPMQIISDAYGPQPDLCPRSEVRPTSNGTLGISPSLMDCPNPCHQSSTAPGVFVDEAGIWLPVLGDVARSDRLPNPILSFPMHDNGAVFDVPAPSVGGERAVSGTLTFGVGTAANNQLGAARIVPVDEASRFTTVYGGVAFPRSTIDSGTETNILEDLRLPVCARMAGAFCVDPPRQLEATLMGRNGERIPLPFSVGDYETMMAHGVGASDAMAVPGEPGSTTFVWGAPFFMGRRVFVVLDGKTVPGEDGTAGPFYAIENRLRR